MAQNRPIESGVKGTRFDMGELIYQSCWAFMRELRTHNKTKRIFDVDPYAEVFQFRDNMYGIFSHNLNGGGDPWCYVIIGPEKAMLIDTGCGLGDLKGLVNEITNGMPLIVANTHAHSDHCMGNFQFDTVYCLEADAEGLYKSMTASDTRDRMIGPDGKCLMVDFDVNDLQPQREYEVVCVPDGYIFNLGGDYEVELIQLAGHSKGQAAYLDRKGRTLFAGDDIIAMRVSLLGEPGTVRDYRERMARLAGRAGEFDGVFPGHFIVDLESSVVASMVKTLDAIIESPDDYDYLEEGKRGVTYCKAVHGMGCIGYNPKGI